MHYFYSHNLKISDLFFWMHIYLDTFQYVDTFISKKWVLLIWHSKPHMAAILLNISFLHCARFKLYFVCSVFLNLFTIAWSIICIRPYGKDIWSVRTNKYLTRVSSELLSMHTYRNFWDINWIMGIILYFLHGRMSFANYNKLSNNLTSCICYVLTILIVSPRLITYQHKMLWIILCLHTYNLIVWNACVQCAWYPLVQRQVFLLVFQNKVLTRN
jgi:hypothetical protein